MRLSRSMPRVYKGRTALRSVGLLAVCMSLCLVAACLKVHVSKPWIHGQEICALVTVSGLKSGQQEKFTLRVVEAAAVSGKTEHEYSLGNGTYLICLELPRGGEDTIMRVTFSGDYVDPSGKTHHKPIVDNDPISSIDHNEPTIPSGTVRNPTPTR